MQHLLTFIILSLKNLISFGSKSLVLSPQSFKLLIREKGLHIYTCLSMNEITHNERNYIKS